MLHLLMRYTQALITQIAQTAACNRYDMAEQQLCRWLLLSFDRRLADIPPGDPLHVLGQSAP